MTEPFVASASEQPFAAAVVVAVVAAAVIAVVAAAVVDVSAAALHLSLANHLVSCPTQLGQHMDHYLLHSF